MERAHSRACALSVTPGNSRRSSTAAANSPLSRKTARIAAASASLTTNIAGAWLLAVWAATVGMVSGYRASTGLSRAEAHDVVYIQAKPMRRKIRSGSRSRLH
jgi:hypothetical protein